MDFGEHHRDLFTAIDARIQNKRVCRAEPRLHGKTSIVGLAAPLRELAFQWKHFILMIGESATTAESNLGSIIEEMENNMLLLEDFPHLAPSRDKKGQLTKWTDRQLVFASGATIVAKGMGARLRGLKRKSFRPDLAILDDPESPETSDTVGKRKRHKNWFGGTFYGLGAQAWDIYVIGNLVHNEGLLAELLKSEEWDSKVYKAENVPVPANYPYRYGNTKTDGTSLWPGAWPIEKLRKYERQPAVGRLNYRREMMNEPLSDADKVFETSRFKFFDYTPSLLRTYDLIVTFIDPAGGQKPNEYKQGKKDFAAIVTIGRRKKDAPDPRCLDVIDCKLTKELPDRQIEHLLDAVDDFRPSVVGTEDNMFKNLLKSNIDRRSRERGIYPNVLPITQSQNKITRILSTQGITEDHTLRFARHLLTTCPELFSQYDDFPGVHDDGPDAIEGAIRIIEQYVEPQIF